MKDDDDWPFATTPYSRHQHSVRPAPSLNEEGLHEDLDLQLAMLDRSDFANGQRLVRRHGHNVCYVYGIGYLSWDGVRWLRDPSDLHVRRLAHQTGDLIATEAAALQQTGHEHDACRELIKWRLASQNSARIEAMIREARPYVEQSIDLLDAKDFTFNAANISIDLNLPPDHWESDIEVPFIAARSPLRDDLITLKANVDYDPDASCPNWERFLSEALPDSEIREFLQRWCGYVLTGSGEEQVLVICFGIGANGKSTFMETISYILGEYATGLPFASLLHNDRKRGSEATPDIARLRGARLVVTSEPDIGARFSESTIKQLTGGDRVTARDLHKGFFEFRPTFKLMLSVNNRPQIRGQDEGIWRRLLLVPFDRVIPAARRNRRLPEALKLEASGILNWMIDGYCDWRVNGLGVPDRVNAATKDYRESEDPVGSFLSGETRAEKNASIRATDLYRAYLRWCHENSETEFSQQAFGRIVTERGLPKVKSGVYYYRGIELVRPLDDTDDTSS